MRGAERDEEPAPASGLLALVLAGALSDRWGRKWMIAAGMWVQALGIWVLVIGQSEQLPVDHQELTPWDTQLGLYQRR